MLDLKNAGLTELLNNFYTLTGLKLCIFDTDFEECASTPIKLYPLCLRAREDPEFERRCHSCDAAHMQICRRTRKPDVMRGSRSISPPCIMKASSSRLSASA